MKVVNDYPSVVTMERIYFDKLEFQREDVILSDELNVSFNKSIEKLPEETPKYRVTLQCTIEERSHKSLRIFVSMVGIFECVSENPALLDTLVNENTVAIMFPFLRTQVSLISTQPDMPPVILPAMNINSLSKDINESPNQAKT